MIYFPDNGSENYFGEILLMYHCFQPYLLDVM